MKYISIQTFENLNTGSDWDGGIPGDSRWAGGYKHVIAILSWCIFRNRLKMVGRSDNFPGQFPKPVRLTLFANETWKSTFTFDIWDYLFWTPHQCKINHVTINNVMLFNSLFYMTKLTTTSRSMRTHSSGPSQTYSSATALLYVCDADIILYSVKL